MYHVRALDDAGTTIRQLTINFPTLEAATAAAARADRQFGDKHVVCESLDPRDPRNDHKNPGRAGFAVVE
jgi:hypothetical protein